MATLSLTGKQTYNPLNLTGKSMQGGSKSATTPYYITKIKSVIFDRYITPILGKKWKMLKENLFQMNDIMRRVDIYYANTQDESLLVYKYILQVVKGTVDTAEELTTLEGKIFDNGKDLAKVTFRVPRIRLKPEMELYNLIIGKPDGTLYDKGILEYIGELLKTEYITFSEIEEKLKKKKEET
jgi:hypothetical protein